MWRILKESWLVLGLLVGAVTASIMLVYVPQGRKFDSLRAAIASREVELAAKATKAAVVPELLCQVESMKQRYKDFHRRLPQRQELGGFLREISHRLGREDLSNQLIEPGNPAREELFHTLPIIMRFKGSYLSLASLLERIDRMERLTRVQRLKIAGQKKGRDLDIELQMNIYFTES